MTTHVSDNIIEARGLTKRFYGFTAVDGVDLDVKRHSIHALIGPNGAGKTTCFNLITKVLQPSDGAIRFNGVDITAESPARVARRGIVRSFQISAIFPRMTVAENVRIALQRPVGTSFHFWRPERSLKVLDERVDELLETVGLLSLRDRSAADLPYGRKRVLEFATTLALEPELLLLDEPTSGLGSEDVERIADLIRSVSKGRTILMVEHNLSVVSRLADRITVLARGKILAEGPYSEVSTDSRVVEAYIGGEE
ncbi:ABC transporter ATP-binding protein [Aquamicrobium sp. LC103]|uniref:ABC transporter ATP-binding protein n=1 Tax=Aquamicrobium sp. LC103 TaxID=1120658 RepID=UPI00063E8C18|nr:ABC transporter ATP-binding protein [Aquamicrobium sp. LC103]TKT75724.1 ABC transporter ATP-binding protein [Aquamicrobium sp. LC103]